MAELVERSHQSSQFTAACFRDLLAAVAQELARPLLYDGSLVGLEEVRLAVAHYNDERRSSSLGQRVPNRSKPKSPHLTSVRPN